MRRRLGMRVRALVAAAGLFATIGVAAAPPAWAFVECRDLGVSLPGTTISVGDEEIIVPAMSNIGVCFGVGPDFENPPKIELREGCGVPCFVIDLDFKTAENFGFSVGYYYTDEQGNVVGDHIGNPYMPISPPVPICVAVGNPRPAC